MQDRLYVQHILEQLRVQKVDRYASIGCRCPDALAEFEVLLVETITQRKYSCFRRYGRCADYEGANHEGAHNQGPDQGSDQGSDQGAHDRGADYKGADDEGPYNQGPDQGSDLGSDQGSDHGSDQGAHGRGTAYEGADD